MRSEPEDHTDAQLMQLLAVEARLQGVVRAAREDAARRVAAARAAHEQRLAAAREESGRRDEDDARAERVAHEAALAEIERAGRAALAAIAAVSDATIDRWARWALSIAIGAGEDPTGGPEAPPSAETAPSGPSPAREGGASAPPAP